MKCYSNLILISTLLVSQVRGAEAVQDHSAKSITQNTRSEDSSAISNDLDQLWTRLQVPKPQTAAPGHYSFRSVPHALRMGCLCWQLQVKTVLLKLLWIKLGHIPFPFPLSSSQFACSRLTLQCKSGHEAWPGYSQCETQMPKAWTMQTPGPQHQLFAQPLLQYL